ncbi:MAG: hypothetical protein AAFQ02_00755 [Bacteroidota bacterium]
MIGRRFLKSIVSIAGVAALLLLICLVVLSQGFAPYVGLFGPRPIITAYLGYYAGVITLLIIPILFLGRALVRFIFGHRGTFRFGKLLVGFWVVGMVVFFATVIFGVRGYQSFDERTEVVATMNTDRDQAITLEVQPAPKDRDLLQLNFGNIYMNQRKLFATRRPHVRLQFSPSDTDQISISRTVKSNGTSPHIALRNSSTPQHLIKVNEENQTISVSDYYTLKRSDRYRRQRIDVDVHMPVGAKVRLDNRGNIFSRSALRRLAGDEGTIWTMTSDGLEQVAEGG